MESSSSSFVSSAVLHDGVNEDRRLKRFEVWIELINLACDNEGDYVRQGFHLLLQYIVKLKDEVAGMMSKIYNMLSDTSVEARSINSQLSDLFLKSIDEWLESLILRSSSKKVRKRAELLCEILGKGYENDQEERRRVILAALIRLVPSLRNNEDQDQAIDYMKIGSSQNCYLTSFCDVLMKHIKTKEDLELFEKYALQKGEDGLCFLPSLVFKLDERRKNHDDDKLALMKLWIHVIDTAIDLGESENEAAKKWDVDGVVNDQHSTSSAEQFSNHYISLSTKLFKPVDPWNALAISTYYEIAARLCVVHPEESITSFLSTFTSHDNWAWALREIVIKRWFKFQGAVNAISKVVRTCVKHRQKYTTKLMKTYLRKFIKCQRNYLHYRAGAMILIRIFCMCGSSYVTQLLEDEIAFETMLSVVDNMEVYVSDKDLTQFVGAKIVEETFKIIIAIRSRVEQDKDIWEGVKDNIVNMMNAVVKGTNILNGLSVKLREEICEAAVHLFTMHEKKEEDDDDAEFEILTSFDRVLEEGRNSCVIRGVILPICRRFWKQKNTKSLKLRRLVTTRCALWMVTEMKESAETFTNVEVVSIVRTLHEFLKDDDVKEEEIISLNQELLHAGSTCWCKMWNIKECREYFQTLCCDVIRVMMQEKEKISQLRDVLDKDWNDEEPKSWLLNKIDETLDLLEKKEEK